MNNAVKYSMHLLACLSAASLVGCGGDTKTNTNADKVDPAEPVASWQLVWNDEFDADAIDSQNWSHEVNCDGGGNQEQQCYTDSDENAYVDNGTLKIVAKPAADGAEKAYTSARLVSQNKADFKYGRFEIRAKLPSGQGSWPAFWMLPADDVYGSWPRSGEIDILEAVNLKVADADGQSEATVHGTLHYGASPGEHVYSGAGYDLPDGVNPADDFHTYAIEWQQGEIRWYVDNYLYATQRQSEVRYNAKDEAVGLSHRGWYAQYYDLVSGELSNQWNSAPFDQDFFMILNLAVGGDWPENVNVGGIDAEAFTNGQTFEIDYVRVYQCAQNPDTGAGCETVRGGYDSLDDALVEGKAPIPSPPSSGIAQDLTIFSGTINPNWPAWDCCGGSTPGLVEDETLGTVMEFSVGANPTVNGFISRDAFIDPDLGAASPFDASPAVETGSVSFDLKVVNAPNSGEAVWSFKIESAEATTEATLDLSESLEGVPPVTGQWQTYTFPLQTLADKGLDLAAIDVVMVFPSWGLGEGAQYRMTNVVIDAGEADGETPQLSVFSDEINPSWPAWDCCGGTSPTVESEDSEHGAVVEFVIGETATVTGFISKAAFISESDVEPAPFDASAILANGVVQFDLKVVSPPNDGAATWQFKIESGGGSSFVQLPLSESQEGLAPVTGEWQTYTYSLQSLFAQGLDVSAIDVLLFFPDWGAGDGAVFHVDNVSIYAP